MRRGSDSVALAVVLLAVAGFSGQAVRAGRLGIRCWRCPLPTPFEPETWKPSARCWSDGCERRCARGGWRNGSALGSARSGNQEIAQLLIEATALTFEWKIVTVWLRFTWRLWRQMQGMIEMLLAAGAEVDDHLCRKVKRCLMTASRTGNVDAVRGSSGCGSGSKSAGRVACPDGFDVGRR